MFCCSNLQMIIASTIFYTQPILYNQMMYITVNAIRRLLLVNQPTIRVKNKRICVSFCPTSLQVTILLATHHHALNNSTSKTTKLLATRFKSPSKKLSTLKPSRLRLLRKSRRLRVHPALLLPVARGELVDNGLESGERAEGLVAGEVVAGELAARDGDGLVVVAEADEVALHGGELLVGEVGGWGAADGGGG